MSLVIAFDPGKITGVAFWQSATDEPIGGKIVTINGFAADQYDVEELYEVVDLWCEAIDFAQIEKFTISNATIRKARESDPLDVIGYLKYAAWRCGFEVGWSKPADVMKTFTDASLKKANMFTPGKGHANDAARHLAWYLVKNKIRPARDFLL